MGRLKKDDEYPEDEVYLNIEIDDDSRDFDDSDVDDEEEIKELLALLEKCEDKLGIDDEFGDVENTTPFEQNA